jgi:hypothetical protein
MLKTNPHRVPWLGMSAAIPLLPLCALIGILQGDLYLDGLKFIVLTAFRFFSFRSSMTAVAASGLTFVSW